MFKKVISSFLMCIVLFVSFCPLMTTADTATRDMVEQIISGNQDYLVFASIIEKGASAYEVQVFEEIGDFKKTAEKKSDREADSDSDEEIHIFVEGFEKYTYYDDYDYRPQKGDNVLLSLKFNGNSYTIKNGAYRVDSTSREQFSFLLPESFNGSEEALELNALYIYVHSNGEIKGLSIKDGAIYGKDANGEEQKMEITSGVKFLDEFGDTSRKPSAVELYGQATKEKQQSKWQLVLVIIVVGSLMGPFIIRLTKKFEKGYDKK